MKKTKSKFTEQQIGAWKRYELVRAGGKYNMYDPRARLAAGLMEKDYAFVMDNYSEIKKEVEK